jgi:hypothetical protein
VGISMKTLCGLILVCGLAAAAQQQQQPSQQQQQPSLGDIARQYRAQKKPGPPARVLDNDAFAAVNSSTSTQASDTPEDANKASDDKKTDIKSGDSKDLAKVTPTEQQKWDSWKAKLDAQKREVALLQRELDVTDREARVRAANYYADAGAQLRDPAKYAADTSKQQEEIQAKTLLLNAAKQRLADLQDQARKDGVPNSVVDN